MEQKEKRESGYGTVLSYGRYIYYIRAGNTQRKFSLEYGKLVVRGHNSIECISAGHLEKSHLGLDAD